jgi:hypothetical protein
MGPLSAHYIILDKWTPKAVSDAQSCETVGPTCEDGGGDCGLPRQISLSAWFLRDEIRRNGRRIKRGVVLWMRTYVQKLQ